MERDTATTLMLILLLNFLLFPSQSQPNIPLGHMLSSNYTDQQSLFAFKSYITSDPQRVLETWNSSIPFCNWSGVTCNVTKQRVTGLDLHSLGLAGTIAPHIGNLSFLSTLDLGNNTFTGTIPQEIGNLFRLKSLNLGLNSLKGAIPSSLGFCSKLMSLVLFNNYLEGRIPSELGNLSKLNLLVMRRNNLTGQIPQPFANLSSLEIIDLGKNMLTGSIPEGLGHLPRLEKMGIGQNQLDGEIPPSIFNVSSLTVLSLTNNRISGTLPSDMFYRLSNLSLIFLGGNQLSGHLPISLGNASSLTIVDLGANNFIGHIPLLSSLPELQELTLETNNLVTDGERGWDFLTSLANSTQLRNLYLGQNLATGKLPSSIGNLSHQLSEFTILENHLEGSLPAEIGNLVGLSLLSVSSNSFSGSIPPCIGNMSKLQMIYMDGNNFVGEIPESFANLNALSVMSIRNNYLSGTIPSSLGNLQHLQQLDLSDNMLNGTIPVEIFDIPSLDLYLNLSFNSLRGNIPTQLGNLKMIDTIDFSSNQLSGDIPSSIGGCSALEYLNLSNNSLHGQIPKTVGDVKGFEFIDFSSNNLSGEIPVSVISLRFLQYLNLSMNHLQGMVPSTGIFANATVVSLSGNPQLCGGIKELNLPKCNLPRAKSSKAKLIIGLVVGVVAPFTLIIGALVVLLLRKTKQRKAPHVALDNTFPHEYKLYSYHELKLATANFSSENLIGQGSFGSVYKAVFADGIIAAVKVFNLELHGASKSFVTECEALRIVRHRNLVKIISVCSTSNFKALILPFMPKGSLDQWIHKRNKLHEEVIGGLDLRQRLMIAKEVAAAIKYLHYECGTDPIVHCDLKPNNVLLDANMCAHVADFGIARVLSAPNNNPTSSTLGLKGSFGYIAPEYGVGGGVSTKGDVYSYGILVLELFTGKRPTNEAFTETLDIQGWVANGITNNVVDILDDNVISGLDNNRSIESVMNILEIGLRCASTSPEARPTMRDVSLLLEKIIA